MGHLQPEPDKGFVRRLKAELRGDVLFDDFSRGRYATDASIYQVMPRGVVVPKTSEDIEATLSLARAEGYAVTPRGGGTSQCGQTVNDTIVMDLSKYYNRLADLDLQNNTAEVLPGIVLDNLNGYLKQHGLWFPVDVSTASRATIGGMVGNNSCGSRSIRYGTCRDHVLAIEAILADGTKTRFGEVQASLDGVNAENHVLEMFAELLRMGEREADTIRSSFPNVIRRVGGYNIDALVPSEKLTNLAHLLVGSEGTLAFFDRIKIKLSPLPKNKAMGICHFPSFYEAMDATQYIAQLEPTAIELLDSNIIDLARDIPMFRPIIEHFVKGAPEALLMVEFAEPDQDENIRRLGLLGDVMGGLGFRWGSEGMREGGVVEVTDSAQMQRFNEMRKQGLNIMMSMKTAGKPVPFIEDCCVDLPHLADYTAKLQEIFAKHNVRGTFYAHASVGTLHVRPVLNLKEQTDVSAMRAIAEETFELVRSYEGSHSGEHGDGIVRSEFHRMMFGDRMVEMFEQVKDMFDPEERFNPRRIVRAPKMDDRSLLRYQPGYEMEDIQTVFDWSEHIGVANGLQGAIEMCNNNGACRKLTEGVMCPSYRATRNEKDLTRGRANTLRLALSGQLGPNALASDEMAETMKLCISCKGCRRECPTGVDMAKMKIEVQAKRIAAKGLSRRDKMIANLPRHAPLASRFAGLVNRFGRVPAVAKFLERSYGISAQRQMPQWASKPYKAQSKLGMDQADVVIFADTFNTYFEPDNLMAAEAVLGAAGFSIAQAQPLDGKRALCCGRTYLSVGQAEQARAEMLRSVEALRPVLERGGYVVGLEPSCVLTFRDEAPALLGEAWTEEHGKRVMMFEEFIALKAAQEELNLPLAPIGSGKIMLHGHCHQKAFNVMSPIQKVLRLIPDITVELIPASCCGMAGSFGYQAETIEVSKAIGEMSLLPRVREADEDVIIVADGTSCRHQISDLADREALHVARILEWSNVVATSG